TASQFESLRVFRNDNRPLRQGFPDVLFHRHDRPWLAVHEKCLCRCSLEELQPSKNLAVIAVRRKVFDRMNLCAHRIVDAVDADGLRTFYEVAAARARRLEPYKHDGVSPVRKKMHQGA